MYIIWYENRPGLKGKFRVWHCFYGRSHRWIFNPSGDTTNRRVQRLTNFMIHGDAEKGRKARHLFCFVLFCYVFFCFLSFVVVVVIFSSFLRLS